MLNAQKIGGGRPERGLSCEDLEVRIRVREGCSVRADPILGMWGQGRFQSPIERAVELVWGGASSGSRRVDLKSGNGDCVGGDLCI